VISFSIARTIVSCNKPSLEKQIKNATTMKKHISRFGILALAGLLALGIAQPAKANLIVNGGFETGDFDGWTQTDNTGFTFVNGERHSGKFAAWFGAGSLGGILQSFATTTGATYRFDFWLRNTGSPSQAQVFWNGLEILALSDPGDFGYKHYQFTEKAIGASTEIKFLFENTPSWYRLDDVSVSGVPDAGSTFSLFTLASLGIAALRRKLSLLKPVG
jgi:protein with PEP-CTERM/exosortase system signal